MACLPWMMVQACHGNVSARATVRPGASFPHAGLFGINFDDREGSGTSSGTKSFGIMMGGGGECALGAAGFLALEPFGSFPGIADRSYLAGRYVGVVLHGVEAQRMP